MLGINASTQYIKGVGPKKAYRLKRLGLSTIEDLFYHLPKDYEDKRSITMLDSGSPEGKMLYKVEVSSSPVVSRPRRGLTILKVSVKDKSGDAQLIWFNQEFLKDKLFPGRTYLVFGKIKIDRYGRQIQNPELQIWTGNNKNEGLTPLYGLTEGISNNEMKKIIANVLSSHLQYVQDVLPAEISNKYGFVDKRKAIRQVHYPDSMESMKKALGQLAYEELLILQLGLLQIKSSNVASLGISMPEHKSIKGFIENLEFSLTAAQKKVIVEILDDMKSSRQMNRLIQGDVGSGKTIVGIIAMYNAVLNGYQATMMAPTEILALQHYESLLEAFDGTGVKIGFLSGNQSRRCREETLAALADGTIHIAVGTHALIQEEVKFSRLGLAVTDEQHRFGVRQRLVLANKGEYPDIMVMTATPIPRTLALILYGDLDISVIDELPPGRKPIETYAVDSSMEDRIWNFVNKQVSEGRQAYIVCPLIEESESLNAISAESLYEKLKDTVFADKEIALLHGRMNQKEKDGVMIDFKENRTQILVSTTVIEVGVNVPNANLMLVMNAERFGLAQLHQLRGRVGRGEYKSFCIMINNSLSKVSRERMRIMQSTNDGFKISEKDLQLRGPGEFFGTRQHGLPELRIADLIRDIEILKSAQKDAMEITSQNNWRSMDEYKGLVYSIEKLFEWKDRKIMLN